MAGNIRIGALISGGGSNLQAIIDACQQGKIAGKVVFVGTDNPLASGLNRARNHKIPTFMVNYSDLIKRFKENPHNAILPKAWTYGSGFGNRSPHLLKGPPPVPIGFGPAPLPLTGETSIGFGILLIPLRPQHLPPHLPHNLE